MPDRQAHLAVGVTYINPYRFGVPFSPLDLSPALWLDASDTSTITSSGSPAKVSQWNDKSGNARNVTQGTALAQPTTGASTLNAKNVIDFDGTTDFMDTAGLTLVGRQWHLIVAVTGSNALTPIVSNSGGTTEAVVFINTASTPPNRWGAYRAGTAPNFFQSTTTSSAATTAYIVTCDFNGASSTLRVNGAQAASGTVGTNNTNAIRLGRNPATSYAGGKLAEVVIVSGALTAQQVSDWEAYASAKWGITL